MIKKFFADGTMMTNIHLTDEVQSWLMPSSLGRVAVVTLTSTMMNSGCCNLRMMTKMVSVYKIYDFRIIIYLGPVVTLPGYISGSTMTI